MKIDGISAFCQVIKVPQPDGSVLVRAGKPVILDRDEISTAEFAKGVGLSQRQVQFLVETGRIPARQPGGERGKYLIPRSELIKRLAPV